MDTQMKDASRRTIGHDLTGDKSRRREIDLLNPKLEFYLLANPLNHAL